MAYLSNEDNVERGEANVRPFDASKPEAPPAGKAVRIPKGRRDRHGLLAAGRQGQSELIANGTIFDGTVVFTTSTGERLTEAGVVRCPRRSSGRVGSG